MNTRNLVWVAAAGMMALGACNYTVGECWPVGQSDGPAGVGGSGVGVGVGGVGGYGFGDAPKTGGTGADACNKVDKAEETPPPDEGSPALPDAACEVPSWAGDGATFWACAPACASKCPAPGGGTFVNFKPSEFPFKTIVKDDGQGKAGGWQVAQAKLEFTEIVLPWTVVTWVCPITIRMPIRTELMGKISASQAANYSVEITEDVARKMDYSLPQGIFCSQFADRVDKTFKSTYPLLGASAKL